MHYKQISKGHFEWINVGEFHDDEMELRMEGKVHIFWEGLKILRNLHLAFDCMYCSQKWGEDFAKICGILRVYELHKMYLETVVECSATLERI